MDQITKHFSAVHNRALFASFGVIALGGGLYKLLGLCPATHNAVGYLQCIAFDPFWVTSIIVLVATLLSLWFYGRLSSNRWLVHVVLQLVALIAIWGFAELSFPLAVLFGGLLTMVYLTYPRSRQGLLESPVYALILTVSLLIIALNDQKILINAGQRGDALDSLYGLIMGITSVWIIAGVWKKWKSFLLCMGAFGLLLFIWLCVSILLAGWGYVM